MNYLAHLYFARNTSASVVGNLLGDFVKGDPAGRYPPAVVAGIRTHRAIDAYTDRHPIVQESRTLFSPERRRFTGIILDLCWDHFLHTHWDRYTDQQLQAFIQQSYRRLQGYEGELPPSMERMVQRMVAHDWLGSYGELANIGLALDRIAARLSRPTALPGAVEEIERHYPVLERHFLILLPDLQTYVSGLPYE